MKYAQIIPKKKDPPKMLMFLFTLIPKIQCTQETTFVQAQLFMMKAFHTDFKSIFSPKFMRICCTFIFFAVNGNASFYLPVKT